MNRTLNKDDVQKLKNDFVKSQHGRRSEEAWSNNKEWGARIRLAIDLAYDDVCRTLTGAGRVDGLKEHVIDELAEGFEAYFEGGFPEDHGTFEEKHRSLCASFIAAVDERKGKVSVSPQYGQAQKIINMTFKYLYCCISESDSKEWKAYFKYCHIPLDRFTLAGLKRINGCKEEKVLGLENKILGESWSKFDDVRYYKIAEAVAEGIEKNKFVYFGKQFEMPLDAELYMWPVEKDLDTIGLFSGGPKAIEELTKMVDLADSENEKIKAALAEMKKAIEEALV